MCQHRDQRRNPTSPKHTRLSVVRNSRLECSMLLKQECRFQILPNLLGLNKATGLTQMQDELSAGACVVRHPSSGSLFIWQCAMLSYVAVCAPTLRYSTTISIRPDQKSARNIESLRLHQRSDSRTLSHPGLPQWAVGEGAQNAWIDSKSQRSFPKLPIERWSCYGNLPIIDRPYQCLAS